MRARKPSPSMIVACLALFVALGGTGIAASRYVISSTAQIRPSVLKSLRGRRGPTGPRGPAGPAGAVVSMPPAGQQPAPPVDVAFFSGTVANNDQSQVFATAGYTRLALTLECSTPAEVVIEVSNGGTWAGVESKSCSHPGEIHELAVHAAYYRLLVWSAESPLHVTALGHFT
jgi:hypothetical protein